MKEGDVDGWFREDAYTTRHKARKAARALVRKETFDRPYGGQFWAQEGRDEWRCWMKMGNDLKPAWQRSCGMEIRVEAMEVL